MNPEDSEVASASTPSSMAPTPDAPGGKAKGVPVPCCGKQIYIKQRHDSIDHIVILTNCLSKVPVRFSKQYLVLLKGLI